MFLVAAFYVWVVTFLSSLGSSKYMRNVIVLKSICRKSIHSLKLNEVYSFEKQFVHYKFIDSEDLFVLHD